jgi:hypothetical protein
MVVSHIARLVGHLLSVQARRVRYQRHSAHASAEAEFSAGACHRCGSHIHVFEGVRNAVPTRFDTLHLNDPKSSRNMTKSREFLPIFVTMSISLL